MTDFILQQIAYNIFQRATMTQFTPYYTSEIRQEILQRDFNERWGINTRYNHSHVIETISVPGKPNEHHVIFEHVTRSENGPIIEYQRFDGKNWIPESRSFKERFTYLYDEQNKVN